MIHEFAQRIYVDTPQGRGRAIFIETGPEEYYWTVELLETRALITFRQSKIRAGRSYTDGKGITDKQMRKLIK